MGLFFVPRWDDDCIDTLLAGDEFQFFSPKERAEQAAVDGTITPDAEQPGAPTALEANPFHSGKSRLAVLIDRIRARPTNPLHATAFVTPPGTGRRLRLRFVDASDTPPSDEPSGAQPLLDMSGRFAAQRAAEPLPLARSA